MEPGQNRADRNTKIRGFSIGHIGALSGVLREREAKAPAALPRPNRLRAASDKAGRFLSDQLGISAIL